MPSRRVICHSYQMVISTSLVKVSVRGNQLIITLKIKMMNLGMIFMKNSTTKRGDSIPKNQSIRNSNIKTMKRKMKTEMLHWSFR